LARAKDVAEDWYLTMIGKGRAGELLSEKNVQTGSGTFSCQISRDH